MSTKVEAFSDSGPSKKREDWVDSLWVDFSQSTGFHGVNKLATGSTFRFRCVWWTFAVLGMAVYMSYNVTKELLNYYEYPTVTNSKVELLKELEFPAITICNHSPLSKKNIETLDPELLEFYDRISPANIHLNPIDWDTEFLRPIFRDSVSFDTWRSMSMNQDAMLIMCALGSQIFFPCTQGMKMVLTNEGMCQTFNFNTSAVQKVRMVGENQNFILMASVQQEEYVVGNMLSAGLRVLVHEAHDHPDSVTSSILVSTGTTTNVAVRKSSFKYLKAPFKAFGDRHCLDTRSPSFNNTLQSLRTYTYGNCVYECLIQKTDQQCGCRSRFDIDSDSDLPMCSLYNLTVCYRNNYVLNRFNEDFLEKCGCEKECEFNTFEAKVSSAVYPSQAAMRLVSRIVPQYNESYIRDNFIQLKIYYEDLLIHTTEQTPKYTVETILGSLGGQMGICLGASFLTLTELVELLLFSCLRVFSRRTKR